MKAAALMESVARFHPLIDGNKRTAWTLMVLMLWINGCRHDFSTDEAFDLVVVDFLEAPSVTRIEALKPAMKKVRAGGYLLLDDSDRPGYAEAFELLAGWRFRKFTGVKDEWPEACETGIFRKPATGALNGHIATKRRPSPRK